MINAQALIGTTPGTCTLQKIIGQGAMGAVFLGQQSRPARQVAVKVVAPLTSQHSDQQTVFLERFHQEMTAVAALKHQNILPIYEHGVHDGLAYLVMPYISSGTLQHVLAQKGSLPLAKVADYLSQLAAALDCAHQQGVVHRNVQPANVLKTPDGRLLLTDFGLVKIVVDRQTSQMRLLQAGKPVGALEYMAPEQVMGDVVDARTDLYALGVIVYQMVTGKTPFQSGTPMRLATQLVQTSPPSPCSLRIDLPLAVEQVILRAIAKRAADRYSSVQDFANEFRLALTTASSISVPSAGSVKEKADVANPVTPAVPASTVSASHRSRDLSTLTSQKVENGSKSAEDDTLGKSKPERLLPIREMANAPQTENLSIRDKQSKPAWLVSTVKKPSFVPMEETPTAEETTTESSEQGNSQPLSASVYNTPLPPTRPRQGLRTNLVRSTDATDGAATSARVGTSEQSTTIANRQQLAFTFNFNTPPVPTPAQAILSAPLPMPASISTESTLATPEQLGFSLSTSPVTISQVGQTPQPELAVPTFATANTTGTLAAPDSEQDQVDTSSPPKSTVPNPISPFPASQMTGTLMLPPGERGNMSTVKLTSSVKVVQVPVAGQPGRYVTGFLPVLSQSQPLQQAPEVGDGIHKKLLKQWQKVAALALVVLLVLSVSGIMAFRLHSNQSRSASNSMHKIATPNVQATALAQAAETAEANILLSDPLNQNIHNWPVISSGDKIYVFKDGAYHILNNDPQQSVPALLSGVDIKVPMVYMLTMEEIKGDDTSLDNSFGVILRFSPPQIVHGKSRTTFYTFQVVNTVGGEYQFSKYDDINGPSVDPYQIIWQHPFGKEFRQGQGSTHVNLFKVVAQGKFFTFFVNGQKVGNVEDGSLSEGEVGMIVNLKGTEVAFSNLLLTYS